MNKLSHSIIFVFLLDIILLITGFYNLASILDKPELSRKHSDINKQYENCIFEDDIVTKVNGYVTVDINNLETVLDLYNAGDEVSIEILRGDKILNINTKLGNYYDIYFLISTILAVMFFLYPAIFIFYKIEDRLLALVFHGLMISVVVMLMFTYGSLVNSSNYCNIIIRTIDQLCYLFLSVTFLHFSCLFPERKFEKYLWIFKYIYIVIGTLSIPLLLMNYHYLFLPSNTIFTLYDNIHTYFLRPLFIPSFILVFINVGHSYFVSRKSVDKQKLLWIFISVIWGPSMYLLYLIPGLFVANRAESETIMQILIIVSPITLFIGIYKYSLFDIRMIIKRSFIYGFIFSILISIYMLMIFIFSNIFISEINQIQLSGLATIVLTVLIYQPVKTRVQKIVDRNLFKINYDYLEVESVLNMKFKKCITHEEIGKLVEDVLVTFLKVNNYNLLYFDKDRDELISYSRQNLHFDRHQLYSLNEYFKQNSGIILITKPNVFTDDIQFWDEIHLLEMIKAEIIFCSFSDDESPNSLIILGNKINWSSFTIEDAELLKFIASETGNQFQKINFQKKLLFQNEEISKLAELNILKNYFVSNVSHELKTPLTSISLFSELMLVNHDISIEKKQEYLQIVIGECERLTRLINNLLDFSKIEKGTKEYDLQIIDLNEIVNSVIKSTSYFIKLKNFKLNYENNSSEYLISGDSDSLKEVFYNLIDNSIKYSGNNKEISISTYSTGQKHFFAIQDRGIGIKEEHQKLIFDAYYRVDGSATNAVGGAGLGMFIVYNIIKAHDGSITIESEYGKGTKIIMEFPGVRQHE